MTNYPELDDLEKILETYAEAENTLAMEYTEQNYTPLALSLSSKEYKDRHFENMKTATQSISALMIRERVDELERLPQLRKGIYLNDVSHDVVLGSTINERIRRLKAQLSASSRGGK